MFQTLNKTHFGDGHHDLVPQLLKVKNNIESNQLKTVSGAFYLN